jgi:uncharacterized protein (DUF488 family)
MEIFSIGFTQNTAAQFFGSLKQAGIRRLLDVRLNNTSQLAAFAKRDDLAFFLREICGAAYEHEPLLAPTQEMLEQEFLTLMHERQIESVLSPEPFRAARTALLCSENTAENCHRRLVLEYLQQAWGEITITHL